MRTESETAKKLGIERAKQVELLQQLAINKAAIAALIEQLQNEQRPQPPKPDVPTPDPGLPPRKPDDPPLVDVVKEDHGVTRWIYSDYEQSRVQQTRDPK